MARTLQIVAESLWEAAGPRIGGWPVDAALGSDRTAGSAARRRFGRGGPVDLVALAAYFPQR